MTLASPVLFLLGVPQSERKCHESVMRVSCMDIRMSLEKPGSGEALRTSCRRWGVATGQLDQTPLLAGRKTVLQILIGSKRETAARRTFLLGSERRKMLTRESSLKIFKRILKTIGSFLNRKASGSIFRSQNRILATWWRIIRMSQEQRPNRQSSLTILNKNTVWAIKWNLTFSPLCWV